MQRSCLSRIASACACSCKGFVQGQHVSSTCHWVLYFTSGVSLVKPLEGTNRMMRRPRRDLMVLHEAVLVYIPCPVMSVCALFEFIPVICSVNVSAMCHRSRQLDRVLLINNNCDVGRPHNRTNQIGWMVSLQQRPQKEHSRQASSIIWLVFVVSVCLI